MGTHQFDQQQMYEGRKYTSQQLSRHTTIRKLASTALLFCQVNILLNAMQDLFILYDIILYLYYVHLFNVTPPKTSDNKAHFVFALGKYIIVVVFYFFLCFSRFRRPDRALHYRSCYISLSVLEG